MVGFGSMQLLLIFAIQCGLTLTFAKLTCNVNDLVNDQCKEHQTCVQLDPKSSEGICECVRGYDRLNDTHCQKAADPAPDGPNAAAAGGDGSKDGGGHTAAVLVSVFLVALVICAASYVSYRYKVHVWLRNKLSQRNSSYNEFIIGQDLDDDPPLG